MSDWEQLNWRGSLVNVICPLSRFKPVSLHTEDEKKGEKTAFKKQEASTSNRDLYPYKHEQRLSTSGPRYQPRIESDAINLFGAQ